MPVWGEEPRRRGQQNAKNAAPRQVCIQPDVVVLSCLSLNCLSVAVHCLSTTQATINVTKGHCSVVAERQAHMLVW